VSGTSPDPRSDRRLALPRGFNCHVANIGVKDSTTDFAVVAADSTCAAAGVFTKSLFAGPSVLISRRNIADGNARAMVVVSKNANVANGDAGRADADELTALVADALGCHADEILLASTGVIGRRYPMDRIRAGARAIPAKFGDHDALDLARAIMTTDTVEKTASAPVGQSGAVVVGVAKGVGMIEPDMATLIAVVLTDADVTPQDLDTAFRSAVDRTLNCVSVDSDTSTSDTAVVLASGAAGPVDTADLEAAFESVLGSLARQIARDGEGATKLLEVHVDTARDDRQAKVVAKAIVNSPLVKTAVHGADPNWGRVAMAVGKCSDETDIDPEHVTIRFGDLELYPRPADAHDLEELTEYLRGEEVRIHVSLGTGRAKATVWGCDLSDGYVRINADYTT
jgi:glutamate N-acetyltransferase / amino-acid N-acetyltransferase